MNNKKYKNRYGDVFTFTLTEDGNVLWEGDFGYSRMGFPNVYDTAYAKYQEDGGDMNIEQFKEEVHKYESDTDKPSEIGEKYRSLVHPDSNTINMVDPSGGPYLTSGMKFTLNEEISGVIERFESVANGYKIILNNEPE